MAKTPARPKAAKLKVYCMPAGFYDAVVAAPSQAAALRAWGTTTDLFAVGRASVVDDPLVQAEALGRPGEVIKRSRGDKAAMLGPEPVEQPTPKARKAAPERKRTPPSPDRSELDAAERALAQAERDLSTVLDAISKERADLDVRESEARSESEVDVRRLHRVKEDAEKAYSRALEAARRR